MTRNDLTLTIQLTPGVDPVEVTDSLNESLRALAQEGLIDDLDDDGWAWEPQP